MIGNGAGALGDVSVSVDPTQVVREIDPSFFGANVEWPEMAKGLVDPATGALDANLVALMRLLGLGSLRFLGNDFYHWQVAVGPMGQRGDNYNPDTLANEPSVLGPDEFAAVREALGAQGIVSVNAGTGDAAEAASWVRYTNLTLQKPVTWWEIGNEPYNYSPTLTPFDQVYQTPEQYAARVREYAQAMKAVDPTIRVGAGTALDTGNYQTLYHPDWNQRVLAAVADIIDFVALHNGYAPLTGDTVDMKNPVERKRAYDALLAAPDYVAENVRQVRDQINQAAGQRADRISIAVTEYAAWFGISPDDVDQSRALVCALYTADLLRAYLAEPSVVTVHYMPVIDRWNGAPIRNGYDQRVLSPVYWVLQLFGSHFGRLLIKSTVSGSPTYSFEGAGIVPPRDGVPYVTAQASVNSAGDQVYVMLVNKHDASSQQTVINVEGQSSLSSAQAWTLTGPAMNAINGPSLTDTTVTADPPIMLNSLPVQVSGSTVTVTLPPRSVNAVTIGGEPHPMPSPCTFAPDAQPPGTVEMSINGGALCTASREVALSVSATGAAETRFRNEGGAWEPWEPYSSQRFWNLPPGDGQKTVWVQCRDACGYLSPEASGSITLDATAPDVAMTSPASGAQVRSVVELAADASDANGVGYVVFSVDGVEIGGDATAPYEWLWDTRSLSVSEGEHVLGATAYDNAGNRSDHTIAVTVDNTAPDVAITSPASGAQVGSVVALAADATDANGVGYVVFSVDGVEIGADATAPYEWLWDTRSLSVSEGEHVLGATAYDSVGNRSDHTIPVTVDNGTFGDVPKTHVFWRFIEAIYAWGLTSGCSDSPLLYCPSEYITRGQMAKFLCIASGKEPLFSETPRFADVPQTHPFYAWIERLADGASWGGNPPTTGCGGGSYCPDQIVTRWQMAKFLCVVSGKGPLDADTPTFSDVSKAHPFYGWIERLADSASWGGNAPTWGCTAAPQRKFCPNGSVTRGEMAKFLSIAFGLAT
jgi:alpha-L-arabinofuranosidase